MQVYGIVGNPVAHSRSPALHNAAFAAAGLDAVYVPLLVDELAPCLAAFPDLAGLSVTIPHKAGARAFLIHLIRAMHQPNRDIRSCVLYARTALQQASSSIVPGTIPAA